MRHRSSTAELRLIDARSFSEQLQTAFEARADIRDLLQDRVVLTTNYQAEISPTTSLRGIMAGEAVLGGSVVIDEQPVRYTISTPFVIQDGQVTQWALTRAALEKMRQDIAQHPMTRRIVKAVPEVQINMWYFEPGELPHDWINLRSSRTLTYELTVPTCDINNEQALPREGVPLQAFGFNNNWLYWGHPDFVLLDGQPVVYDLSWISQQAQSNQVTNALMPTAFKQLPRPFEGVWAGPIFGDHSRALRLSAPKNAAPAEQTAYRNLIDTLPGTLNQIDENNWELLYTTLNLNEAGELEVAACP